MSTFELEAADGAARTGVLRTAHGELRTPAFMPVGTKATVKAVDPDELEQLGAEILLCNTYHLHFRPGADLIAELGGLHRFMAWNGPILTDSGGFQVFSLRHTIVRQDDEGVTFRSVYDGDEARFTPEHAAQVQAQLGSDIAMCLDVVPPPEVPRVELAEAVRRTTLWARRQHQAERAPGQLLFGIAQGGTDRELRRRSVEEIAEIGFDGYALGGLAIGESREEMLDTTAWATELLPEDRPRYFMGIGDPVGHPRGDRARGRHVRLRAPDPQRAHRLRPDLGGPAQPQGRTLRPRPASPRRGLRLSRLHALLARVRAAPPQPAGDPGAAPPEPA